MGRRLKLSEQLHQICDNVYYQPPEGTKLDYPCLVYKLTRLDPWHADNKVYHMNEQYTITVIDRDPDSELRDQVSLLPFCHLSRSFENENLHHWVFNIYS